MMPRPPRVLIIIEVSSPFVTFDLPQPNTENRISPPHAFFRVMYFVNSQEFIDSSIPGTEIHNCVIGRGISDRRLGISTSLVAWYCTLRRSFCGKIDAKCPVHCNSVPEMQDDTETLEGIASWYDGTFVQSIVRYPQEARYGKNNS